MLQIGEKIRTLREKKHLSQEEMADRLGYSQQAYSKIERNQSDIRLSVLHKVAEVLEIDVTELLADKSTMIVEMNHSTHGINYQNHITYNGLSATDKEIWESRIALIEKSQNEVREMLLLFKQQFK